jgi:hypothetical protein
MTESATRVARRGFSQEKVGESTDPQPMSAVIEIPIWIRDQSTKFIWKRLVMQGGWFLP